VGSTTPTYVSLAERVQAQTGVSYLLVDGRFENTAGALRLLGDALGATGQAGRLAVYAEAAFAEIDAVLARTPETDRPRVYLARGPEGLETGVRGSINSEIIERAGGRNVADAPGQEGIANVSLEQVLAWDPEVIITIDQDFARNVRTDPNWASVSAVRSGRVHLSPKLPFGWVDFPPAVNRLVGLWWLGKALYPELFPEDLKPIAREFYARFYHVSVTDEQLNHVLAGRG
jgi:iron complex transport system substrate-binding protein